MSHYSHFWEPTFWPPAIYCVYSRMWHVEMSFLNHYRKTVAQCCTQDSFRFFHRLCLDGLSLGDAEQLLNMTLVGLRQMASDPDVVRSGLAVLADLGKAPGGTEIGFDWICSQRIQSVLDFLSHIVVTFSLKSLGRFLLVFVAAGRFLSTLPVSLPWRLEGSYPPIERDQRLLP